MRFTSTRDKAKTVSFSEAVMDCLPEDGGLYVPCDTDDLRRWLIYTDENTDFRSIAGTLTNAFLKEEFSPIICETIGTKAFPFSPSFKQLDKKLFYLDLTTGPTGIHRDFGISYLASCLETICQYQDEDCILLDVTKGELGASLAHALRGKKHIKAVLVYPEGSVRGFSESDFLWNGGNIYPVEVKGDERKCREMVNCIIKDRSFARSHNVTMANTCNIGRLLPQAFFYPFAFSRIKNKVNTDINYALAPGNFSNVVAGLYAWQFALPLNGFIIPTNNELVLDGNGNPLFLDSLIPVSQRNDNDPSKVSNIERLSDIFAANSLMMRHFVFAKQVSDKDVENAAKELFEKYKIVSDRHTARAYAASKKQNEEACDEYENSTVLIARDSPAFNQEFVRDVLGVVPEMSGTVKLALKPVNSERKTVESVEEIRKIIEKL